MRAVFASIKDSNNEVGIGTVVTRPAQSAFGVAANGEFESQRSRGVASFDEARIGETSVNVASGRGGSPACRRRVVRRSWRVS